MIACVSGTPDALQGRNPSLSSAAQGFGPEDALAALRKCANFGQLKQAHARIIRSGLSGDQLLARKMIQVCSSHNRMDYAALVFRQIERPHAFTWNVMIREYTMNGGSRRAILLYNLMIIGGFAPDKFTFPFVVKACIVSSVIDKGREVHGMAIKAGFSRDIFLQNTLMDLYFKCGDKECGCRVFENMPVRSVVSWTTMISGLIACGDLDAARGTFERMPNKNVVSWTAMINGYVKNGQPQEAFDLFQRMQIDRVEPNEFTLVNLLKACTELGSLKLGGWIHDYALKNGFNLGVFLGTALIDMYSKCGSLVDARQVFDEMQIKSLVTWNAMITSLGVHGCGEEALALFSQMEKANVVPDAITFVGVLCACVHMNDVEKAYELFVNMRELYDITPLPEHYACLLELYNRTTVQDEDLNFLNNVQMKQNNNILAALLEADIAQDVSSADRNFPSSFEEASKVGSIYQCQLPRFKWDVG
ncbi:hypothetical protein BT93_G1231 [Corymbia citriodora subsp. variegata]|nr:hypothetical protein BT93_G1231 [Corymbia citriodora subsp. variegata]